MATDIEKGLPVRTEDDPDQYVRVKLADDSTPSQFTTVDSDGNAHVEVHGNKPDASDVALALSEEGRPNPFGDYDASTNTRPASTANIVHDRTASPNETHQNVRQTGVTVGNVHSADVALHQSDGTDITAATPLPVTVVDDSSGTETHDYKEDDIAADGTANHEISIADGDVFLLEQVIADASSRARWELQIGDGGAVEVFATKFTWFSKEDSSDPEITLRRPLKVTGTANTTTIRLIKTNTDDDDLQTLYSTLIGTTLP